MLKNGAQTVRPRNMEKYMQWFSDLDQQGKSVETLNRSVMESYQLDILNHLIEYVFSCNDFYFQRLADSGYSGETINWEGFKTIPFVTKDDLRDNFRSVICNAQLAQLYCSTGTTGGKPIYVGHTLREMFDYYIAPQHPSLFGHIRNTIVANCLPYEMSSSAMSFHSEFQHMLQCTVLPLGKGGAYSSPEKALEFMMTIQPSILVTTPSYAISLFETALRMGINPSSDLQIATVLLTGEGVSHALRQKIEKYWNANATIIYGSLETMLLGIECIHQNGFHVPEGHVHMEIIDPLNGRTLGPGHTGEIVITTLLREGMPLIRYRTGDLGYMEYGLCKCGVSLPKVHLRGRSNDQIKLKFGSYSPFYLEDLLMSIAGTGNNYRFLTRGHELTIELLKEKESVDEESLIQTIVNRFEYFLNQRVTVKIVEAIPTVPGKVVRVWKETE
ncbi:phenylacetate--CoA ligase family protein [Paenibacillus sp. L3-i20]|uniref:phenylacetate--CoA ligase family protein n=1 Tax=Paenibacillus sp. L3-i20 TaxID=2905833 RepID=UPI001EE095D9|nr:phenylacetate--CoA ligase family protein [Paenibacillus sp. L3-i20]GKU77248.1 phenylacetate--CoA ligase [Paenibacillus sp. L3-i20]